MNLDQFKNWAIAQGSVGNPTSDRNQQYVGECVSLIQQYLAKRFNIGWQPRGHAKDWASNGNVAQYFDRVGDLQPGDIVVYGPNFGGGYGHIGIYLGNNKILDQNGANDGKIKVNNLYPGYTAILRRKGGSSGGGTVSASQDITDDTSIRLEYNNAYDEDATEADLAAWRGQPNEAMQRGVTNSPRLAERRMFTEKGKIAARDNWEGQIGTLQTQNAAAAKEIADLKAEIAAGGGGQDTVQLNALGAALKWFIARLGLK